MLLDRLRCARTNFVELKMVGFKNNRKLSRCVTGGIYLMLLLKFTMGILPVTDCYDSSDASSSLEETVIKYDNHLNATHYKTMSDKLAGVHRRNFDDSEDLKAIYSSAGSGRSRFDQHPFHCSACQFRSVFAKASLKSIKAHVLLKLGFEYPPNQTNYPKVPDDILRSFNEKISHSQHSRMREAGDNQYMSDDPNIHEQPEDVEEDYDYYQITNKIYIFPNRIKPLQRRSQSPIYN